MTNLLGIDVADLQAGSLFNVTVRADWDRVFADIDGDNTWWEAFTHTDDNGDQWTLVASGGIVAAVVLLDATYMRHEYGAFSAALETRGEPAVTESDFEDLFDIEPHEVGVIGPQFGEFYECQILDRNPELFAAKVVDLNVCIVDIDGKYGFALTGAGEDLSWDIVAAYMAVGQLPPFQFARSLPRRADRGHTTRDSAIIAACIRTCEMVADAARSEAERLRSW